MREIVDVLRLHYCASDDQVWEWLRGMYELGYQAVVDSSAPTIAFSKDNHAVMVRPCAGQVSWFVAYSGRPVDAFLRDPMWPKFPTPMAAAGWWAVEQSNMPAQTPAGWDDIPTAPAKPSVKRDYAGAVAAIAEGLKKAAAQQQSIPMIPIVPGGYVP